MEMAVAILTLEHGLDEPKHMATVLRNARDTRRDLAEILIEEVSETHLLRCIADAIGIRFCDLYATDLDLRIDSETMQRCDVSFLKRFSALPMLDRRSRIVVVVANPTDVEMVDYLRTRFTSFALVLASRSQIQNKLTFYGTDDEAETLSDSAIDASISASFIRDSTAGRTPVQDWVDKILARAVAESSSDIHFLFNTDQNLILRFRIDGALRTQKVPPSIRPMEAIGSILSRCATMDPSNYIEPQDGTFSFEAAGRGVDARVAMLPQEHGPTVVIRLLDSLNMRTRLDDMGFDPEHLEVMRTVMSAPQGTVLVCGPTGSGKSTTLYGLLREVDAVTKNVMTVEDPVEYRLPYIGQTAIRAGLGQRSLTFARALRAILRLDPDIILVGEIRDKETAEVAMQAAITGHLMLSTLHANSAPSAFSRLVNMGVPAFLVADAVDLVVSQRLIRRVHECARLVAPDPADVALLRSFGIVAPDRVPQTTGCPGCNGTGYRGRLAAAELLRVDRDLKSAVMAGRPAEELGEIAAANGSYKPIAVDALRHVKDGKTTISELRRILLSVEI
jgi:type IV pilus assembly protein PilB